MTFYRNLRFYILTISSLDLTKPHFTRRWRRRRNKDYLFWWTFQQTDYRIEIYIYCTCSSFSSCHIFIIRGYEIDCFSSECQSTTIYGMVASNHQTKTNLLKHFIWKVMKLCTSFRWWWLWSVCDRNRLFEIAVTVENLLDFSILSFWLETELTSIKRNWFHCNELHLENKNCKLWRRDQ